MSVNRNNKFNLGYLGEDYQFRIVKALMDDHYFFKNVLPFLNQNYFTNRNLKTITGFLREFVEKENYVPSYDFLIGEVGGIIKNEIELEEVRETIKKIKNTSQEGQDRIRENVYYFFKQQEYTKLANEILKANESGVDYVEDLNIEQKVQKILSIGRLDKIWTTVFDDFENTIAEDYRVSIPMGIKEIDEYLDGGLIKGNLALIAASTGTGKSSLSVSLAAHAATYKCKENNNEGFKILQIYFEDKHKAIKRKHLGKITGIEAKDLSKEEFVEVVKELCDNYEDKELIEKNLKLGKFRTGELTVPQLKTYIQDIVNTGFKPDVIIIDYFECLKNPKIENGSNDWSAETIKMRQLENLTEDFDCLVLVTTQGTKQSTEGMLLTLDKIGGSVGKSQAAHIIITINKTEADKENNRATIFIPKFREGKSGRSFNVHFNNGTCRISVDEFFDSIEDLKENQQKDSKKLTETILKEQLSKFKDNKKKNKEEDK